jgi:hypothetical protein
LILFCDKDAAILRLTWFVAALQLPESKQGREG